ncbi:hypothetical protein [Ruania zhangjianzhongii]|uniref:hypothetical protein n=1 Tax=Ruania zhangjianzhongii TaxID=2603206 RepID=UPI0011C7B2DA|nr:hypothetical protein [Ruania zhangjianzhongii]
MTERAHWRLYPVGPLGSLVRGVSWALSSVPIIAMLMILPFLGMWYVADKGSFGVDSTGLAWSTWAELALGVAVLVFPLTTLTVSVLNLLRTVLTIGALRRAVRQGARGTEVPHPQQWGMATGWTGTGMIVSALLLTAMLAFSWVFTAPVRTWVEANLVPEGWALVPLPVIAIAVVVAFRLWRKKPLAELEGRWTEERRSAAEDAAAARVPNLPTDADGDLVNPATTHRRPLDRAGDRVNSAGLWITVIAMFDAVVTLPVGTSMIGGGFASSTTEALLLSSSVLLVAIAIALYALGALLQHGAQLSELRGLLAAASRPYGPIPELSVLARYWRPLEYPWVNFLGWVGALALLFAVPAALMTDSGAVERWGIAGGVLAVLLLLAAVVVDVAAENVTRDRRNLIMRQWPIPDPNSMNKKAQLDSALEADVVGYGQHLGAGQWAPAAAAAPPPSAMGPGAAAPPGMTGGYYPPPAAGPAAPPGAPYAPPVGTPHAPAGGAYPPPGPYPPPPLPSGSPATLPPPPRAPQGRRRAWGPPKKLRGRGLGDLYR